MRCQPDRDMSPRLPIMRGSPKPSWQEHTPGRCQPLLLVPVDSGADSVPALAGERFLLAWLPPPPRLRARSASAEHFVGLPGTQRTGSSCHGDAVASECQQRHWDLEGSCQGTAVPGGWPGAGHSLGTVTQQASVPLSPFPSPPAALAALTSTSCSVKATLQREKRNQGWRHHGECPLQTPLGCSGGAGHHQKWWPKSPSPREWNGVKVQSLDHVVPCDPPVSQLPEGCGCSPVLPVQAQSLQH